MGDARQHFGFVAVEGGAALARLGQHEHARQRIIHLVGDVAVVVLEALGEPFPFDLGGGGAETVAPRAADAIEILLMHGAGAAIHQERRLARLRQICAAATRIMPVEPSGRSSPA